MIPERFAPVLFGFILSGVVLVIASVRAMGFTDDTLTSRLSSWIVAFPAALIVAPMTRRRVARLTKAPIASK